jgi:4,5:9,10-diseco-3-hydroxy-5,9,17-trioxoandrosta-1(10),2-diene-4-oate hydrolase
MPQDQYIKVGDINTRFWALGDAGKTVVLLHGLGDCLETWIHNIDAIAEHYRVYAIDLVGYGRSDKPSVAYSGEYFAQFVNGFLETQGIHLCALVGNSMGGGVGLRFAIQFPDKVEKLVLEASVGFGEEISIYLRLATLPFVGELLFRVSRKTVTQILNRCAYDPTRISDDWVERVYQMLAIPGAKKAILSTLRTSCNFWGIRREALRPISDNLSPLTVPTLILWGREDRVLPLAHARVAERKIPNAQLHIFESCGHVPHLERPKEFNRVVLEFLSN